MKGFEEGDVHVGPGGIGIGGSGCELGGVCCRAGRVVPNMKRDTQSKFHSFLKLLVKQRLAKK
jgi:hypothetical protein